MQSSLSLVEAELKALDKRKEDINDTLQNINKDSKLFESQYFRDKLKGTLEDTILSIENVSKVLKDQSITKLNIEKFFKETEDKAKTLENQVLQAKRLADE